MRVLIVDDDQGQAETISRSLKLSSLSSFRTSTVPDIATALQEIDQKPYDAIILDLNLSDSQGPETFRRIFTKHPELAIVIVSGIKNDDMAYGFVVAGAQDYFVKGEFDPDQLAKSVLYSCARHTFRTVNTELGQVRAALATMSEKAAETRIKFEELHTSISSLNSALAAK